jgi:hypothetical protein
MKLEKYGYCSKTGKCLNPFGARPLWVINRARQIRMGLLIECTEEALF